MFGLSKRTLVIAGVLVVVGILYIQHQGSQSAAQTSSSGVACQVQVHVDSLNVRSSPDDRSPIVATMTSGMVAPARQTVRNGYRQLDDNRWVSDQFVTPVSGPC